MILPGEAGRRRKCQELDHGVLSSPNISCVILDKPQTLSEPQFFHHKILKMNESLESRLYFVDLGFPRSCSEMLSG